MKLLTPEEELIKYFDSSMYFADDYTVNKDGSFNIPDGHLTFYSLPKFIIHKIRGIEYKNITFDKNSLNEIPKYISQNITFKNCDFSGNTILLPSNRTIESFEIQKCTNIKKIVLNCSITSTIDIILNDYVPFRIAHGEKLKLGYNRCKIQINNIPNKIDMGLHDISNLTVGFGMPDFSFMSTPISNVSDCQIDINKNTTSFRNIETLSGVKTTTIGLYSQTSVLPHNIIHVLLITSTKLDMYHTNARPQILTIMKKYMKHDNRKEHIMDCTMELIDAGFEEAAEL